MIVSEQDYNTMLVINSYRNLYGQIVRYPSIPAIYNPIDCRIVNAYTPLKKLTLWDMEVLVIPFDPIREWAKQEEERIKEKYSKWDF